MKESEDKLHLPEGTYMAYIDGVAAADVVAHIEQCAQCLQEVEALRKMGDRFRQVFKGRSEN